MLYLDNAATTLIKPQSVSRAMLAAMNSAASPGRGGHYPAMKAAELVYSCREAAAELFNVADPEQVVFTMNATHALNIAIHSLVKPGTRVLISGYEHNSVTRPLAALGAEIMVAHSTLFDREAAIESFRTMLNKAELVICTHVSNVFGFILPVYEIAQMCREKEIPFILDASQSAGILDVDFEKLGAAFAAMPGHKALFGPQGTGILLCGRGAKVFMSGGSGSDSRSQFMPEYLPDRLEAGTHNVVGIAGLKAGIDYVKEYGIKNIHQHEQKLLHSTIKMMEKIPGVELFCGKKDEQCGVLSFRVENTGCEELGRKLAEQSVCLRAGLHCAPYAHESAGTLETGTLRLSFSPFVTLENTEEFCRILQNLL